MRLTNTLRDAFVRAAMDDVPEVKYEEQIRKVAKEGAIASMPPEILKAYKKYPDWFEAKSQTVGRYGFIYLPIPSDKKLPAEVIAEVDRLDRLSDLQRDARLELRGKLRSVAYSCTTKKALVAALPEFEQYLPPDEAAACRTLPVVANVVAEFVKAGWPKVQKAVAKGVKP